MGLDFMIDDNLKVWFIEANSGPQIFDNYAEAWAQNERMIAGSIDIVHSLLKSRLTRVRTFMNSFTRDYLIPQKPFDLKEKQNEFRRLNEDRIDDEFMYKKEGNGWEPVVDLNKPSNEAYFGIIKPGCL